MFLTCTRARWDAVSLAFRNSTSSGITNYATATRNTARIEAQQRTALEQLNLAIQVVSDFEARMELVNPWTEDEHEYR